MLSLGIVAVGPAVSATGPEAVTCVLVLGTKSDEHTVDHSQSHRSRIELRYHADSCRLQVEPSETVLAVAQTATDSKAPSSNTKAGTRTWRESWKDSSEFCQYALTFPADE
jgi:hypothetical protein